MTNVIKFLQAMRDKLEQGWCQKFSAVNEEGRPTGSCSPYARCWCISGALRIVEDELWPARGPVILQAIQILREEAEAAGFQNLSVLVGNITNVIQYNDAPGRTQAEVLKFMDDAILRALKP